MIEEVIINHFMDRCEPKLKAFHVWLREMDWWYYKDVVKDTYVVYKITNNRKEELFSIPLNK